MPANHPLTSYRRKHDLTRSALARELSVSRATITRWEDGDRKIDDDMVPHVVRVTGIPARRLRPDLVKLLELS